MEYTGKISALLLAMRNDALKDRSQPNPPIGDYSIELF